jgi:signal transduction histidine kinase
MIASPTIKSAPTLALQLAAELRESRNDLAARWLDRVADRLTTDPTPVFPSRELLEAVPLVIAGIAASVENPALEVTVSLSTVASALELGDVNRPEHLGALDILKKYEVLQSVLFEFAAGSRAAQHHWETQELVASMFRISRSVAVLEQLTMARYMRLVGERTLQREQRLRAFNRLVAHELKNRLGAVRGAVEALGEDWMEGRLPERLRMQSIIVHNAREMDSVLHDITELASLEIDGREQETAPLVELLDMAVAHLRDATQLAGVQIIVAEGVPDVEVPSALVRLCLANYMSNGVKYHDPTKTDKYVHVRASIEGDDADRMLLVQVRDNGVGVATAARKRLFDRFFRAQKSVEIEGMGLGLSIVRETVAMVGGRAWAEFSETESVFSFAIPFRRSSDRPRDPLAPVEG